jgi:heme-degrading monooxygenase HmoA
MANIVRVFRAVVHSGKEEEFKSFFLNDAVPLLRKHKGLVSIQVGFPREETPQEFLMTTVWNSIETLSEFSGVNWYEAVIAPREERLLARVEVNHYYEVPL